MLKFVSNGDVAQAATDAVLICETDDFSLHAQGLMPTVIWERINALKANPKWVSGSMALIRNTKTKRPLKIAFKGDLKVIVANIRNAEGQIDYKSIRRVLMKLRDSYEKLGVTTVSTVFPGVKSGQQFGIQEGVVRSLLKNIFAEDNVGETSGFCVEAFEQEAEQD